MSYTKEFFSNFFKMVFMILVFSVAVIAMVLFAHFGFSLASTYFGNSAGIFFVLVCVAILGSGIYAFLETENKHLKDRQ